MLAHDHPSAADRSDGGCLDGDGCRRCGRVATGRRVGSTIGGDGFAGFGICRTFRIKRDGLTGRWVAIVGIGFGVMIYAIFMVVIARDLIDPIELHP